MRPTGTIQVLCPSCGEYTPLTATFLIMGDVMFTKLYERLTKKSKKDKIDASKGRYQMIGINDRVETTKAYLKDSATRKYFKGVIRTVSSTNPTVVGVVQRCGCMEWINVAWLKKTRGYLICKH